MPAKSASKPKWGGGGTVSSSTTFGAYQTVVVASDTVLADGAEVIFHGTLIVSEGTTLTVKEGSLLGIGGPAAKLVNNGDIVVASADNENFETVVEGTPTLEGIGFIDSMIVNETVFETSDGWEVGDAAVTGTLEVADGKTLAVIGDIAVGGQLFPMAAVPEVIGHVAVGGFLYIAPGATVSGETLAGLGRCAAYIEGELLGTVCGAFGKTFEMNDSVVEDAKLLYWETDAGPVCSEYGTATFKLGIHGTADTKVKYDIYTVNFVAGTGIADLYVDGDLVPTTNSAASASFTAGEHVVTVAFDLGYEGAVPIKIDGVRMSGSAFAFHGEESAHTIQVTGAAPVPEPEPHVPPVPESEDGMSLTDRILIVLVAIILAMAVIVALRFNRSRARTREERKQFGNPNGQPLTVPITGRTIPVPKRFRPPFGVPIRFVEKRPAQMPFFRTRSDRLRHSYKYTDAEKLPFGGTTDNSVSLPELRDSRRHVTM